jgi:hypothetical protein
MLRMLPIRPLLSLERLSIDEKEVDPMVCPKCGGTMKGIALLSSAS